MRKKIAFIANSSWYLYNLRLGVIEAVQREGFDILLIAPEDKYTVRLCEKGYKYIPLTLNSQGTNPFKDFKIFLQIVRIFLSERPDFVFNYTIKPNIYGSLAARFCAIPSISVVSGLGYAFHQQNWLFFLVKFLYQFAIVSNHSVWFVNKDDQQLFLKSGIIPEDKAHLLPGEGIDTEHFTDGIFSEKKRRNGKVRFLLSGRLLWEKGVGVYVEAAKRVKKAYPHAEFGILGFLDAKNPGAITSDQMSQWINEGVIHYLGETDDVRPQLYHTDCFVLPSFYGEGMPRSLLEAASMKLPIITTDNAGCRDVVKDQVNGFICQPKDAGDLADKMEQFLRLSLEERMEFGRQGREKVVAKYHERFVAERYLELLSTFFRTEVLSANQSAFVDVRSYEGI